VLAVINAGQPALVRAYVDSAFGGRMRELPADAHINFFMSQREQSQGLDWVRSENETANSASVVLKSRLTGDLSRLSVRVEDQSPYRIIGLGGGPPPRNAETGASPKTDAEAVAALSQFMTKLAQADVFSGTVLLAKDGKILFSHAYGQANKDFDALNRVDTKFNLGSMNKMFTSVAIAQLVEQGKLSFDDPLSKFLPDFPNPAAAQKIQIKHLLSHTSGLGSYFNDEFERSSRARFRTVDDMMQLAKGDSLAFEPGTRWSYSNTGMLVLGKVIEVATGQDYFQYIREHIYRPAGMIHSDAYELDRVNPNLAVGYGKEYDDEGHKRFRNNLYQHVIRGGPAGGGYSTVEDLLRFATALMSGKLVGMKYVEMLTTPKPELHSPQYGFGFAVEGNTVGHSGGFPGISSNLDIFKGTGYVAAVMSNYSGGSMPVMQRIRQLLSAHTSH
jgi:CubicO group peptidase (beta-lactamase class C family)